MKEEASAKSKSAAAQIACAAALWGLIGVFYRTLAAAGFTPMQIVAFRACVAGAAMLVWLGAADRRKLAVRPKECVWFAGTGICSLVFFNWCYFNAMERMPLSAAAVLLYTAPVIVMLLSAPLFGERVTRRKLAALALALAGVASTSGLWAESQQGVTAAGLLFGLGSGVGYALYSVFGKFALRRCAPETVSAYTFVFAAAAAVPLARFDARALTALADVKLALCAVGIGLVCSMLPYLLYTRGLAGTTPGRAALLATLEPAVAAAAGVFVFHEEATPARVIGIVCIVGAVALLNGSEAVRQ